MKDFNIAKYLKENHLGPHAILGGYVDLHALKEEEEMELDTEIPYEGPERKVDGFGDKFKQTNAVEEADSVIFDRGWEDTILDILSREYRSWLDQNNLPQMSADELLNDPNIEKTDGQIKYLSDFITRWEDAQDDEEIYGGAVEEDMNDDDSENPFPSIMKGKKDSVIFDKGWQYDDDEDEVSNDDRFADLGGDQIKSAIKSLMDDGFDTREIAQFVVDTIRGFKSFKEEVTVSSSGVQMEGEEFKWTARDQQGKLHGILYVKPMGDTLMVTADDGMQGTKYTKADIADAMGRGEFIRFRGKDLALDTRMKAWANS